MAERQYVARSTNLVDRRYAAETPTDAASVSERGRPEPVDAVLRAGVRRSRYRRTRPVLGKQRQRWRSGGSALLVRSTSPIVEICSSSMLAIVERWQLPPFRCRLEGRARKRRRADFRRRSKGWARAAANVLGASKRIRRREKEGVTRSDGGVFLPLISGVVSKI